MANETSLYDQAPHYQVKISKSSAFMYSIVEYIRGLWTRKNIEKFPVAVNGSIFSSDSLDYLIPLFTFKQPIFDGFVNRFLQSRVSKRMNLNPLKLQS
jgi:hypothetical protein